MDCKQHTWQHNKYAEFICVKCGQSKDVGTLLASDPILRWAMHKAAHLVNSSDGVPNQTESIDRLAALLAEAHANGRRAALNEAADIAEAKAKSLDASARSVGMVSLMASGCQIAAGLIRKLMEKEDTQ